MRRVIDRRTALGLIAGGTVSLRHPAAWAQTAPAVTLFTPDDTARAAAADDYGHFVRRLPRLVARPRSADDVAKVLELARRELLKVAVRGQGHSSYGQSQIEDGIVLDMSGMARVGPIVGDTVEVEGGALWQDVLAASLPRGLTVPVLPDAIFLSVGGTLSVGGLGDTSFRFGAQVDHVHELEILTVTGRRVLCSDDKEQELFFAALAGLGQVGVILRARIALLRAPTEVTLASWAFTELDAYLNAQRMLLREGGVDHLTGRVLREGSGWVFRLDAGRFHGAGETPKQEWPAFPAGKSAPMQTVSFKAYLNRLDAIVVPSKARGDWTAPHPSFQFFMAAEETGPFLKARIDNAALMAGVRRFDILTVYRSQFLRPNLQMPGDRYACIVRLLRTAPKGNADALAAQLRANQTLLGDVIKAGAKIYPPYAPIPPLTYWPQHFGAESWARITGLRRDLDPAGLLNTSAMAA